MMTGTYYHTVESSGRVSVPVKFRELLGEHPIITKGFDGCLFLFSQAEWQKLTSSFENASVMKKANRDVVRSFAYSAHVVSFDETGRVLIPDHLRASATLEKSVVFAGAFSRVEIWNEKSYAEYVEKLEKTVESSAESFEEVYE